MLKNNYFTSVILLFAFVFGFNTNLKANDKANTIAIATTGEPSSLDIHYARGGVWEHMVYQDVYAGLFAKSSEGKSTPNLVESYNVSKDGKTYTFKLKKSNWSDGVPVTAKDFEFAYKRILSAEVASNYAGFLFMIKNAEAYSAGKATVDSVGVKAVDDYTLQITLEYPAAYFTSALTHFTFYPVPKHKVEQLGKGWSKADVMVNNGAYKITEWKANSYVKATRNIQFWDNKNTKIENIVYYTQEDRGALLKRFRAGELDISDDFDSGQYEWLKANLPAETKIYPYNAVFYLSMNVTGTPNKALANPNVRKAIAMAIDREFITNNVLKSGEVPAYSFVPKGLEKYNPVEYSWKNLSKDAKKAQIKELLKSAGFDENNPLKFELAYTVSEGDKKIAIALASMLKDYNIQVTTNVREVSIHYAELQKQSFEIGRARWVGDYDEASTFLDLLLSNNGQNYGAYKNPTYDKLITQAKASLKETDRNKLYAQAEKMILDENINIPIYYLVSKVLVNQRVVGWKPNTGNFHEVRFLSFK
jgi:oligopeptide transport system substrate-binding protein